MNDRRATLEQHGRAYGDLGLALAFTDGTRGEAAKIARGWKTTECLPHAARGVSLLTSRGQSANPIVCLRTSGLVGIDIDGEAGTELARSLELVLPATVTVRTGNGWHLWYRPPEGAPGVVVKVQLAENVTVSADGYFVIPPGVHPNGHVYRFAADREPWVHEIATVPQETIARLVEAGRVRQASDRSAAGEIAPGDRHEHLRAISYAMRRYSGASVEAITAALVTENELRCRPPKPESLVRELAAYTHKNITPLEKESSP